METQIKNLTTGSLLYALIKGDDQLTYVEGSVTGVSAPRNELPRMDVQNFMPAAPIKTVVDLTYQIEGKTYTDAVEASATMFPTEKPGAITLVATDPEPVLRELRVTQKKHEDYIKETETGIPKARKRIKQCKDLIAKLDTSYAKEQAYEERFKQIEAQNAELKAQSAETNQLLRELISKFKTP